jgi:hypothetical protein
MEIRKSTSTNGEGLFSMREYKKGDILHILCGVIFDEPTRETIHIGDNRHIYDKFGIYINHSFNPNIYINGRELIALRDIKIDDELFFNYNDTEMSMANPFYDNDILVCGKNNEK